MKKQIAQNKIETIGNGIALILGLAFLGDIFELWNFSPFSGWWILFLYIPAVCGFLTKGVTAGGVMLALTAIVLTVGIFTDVDGRLWSVALLLYLAYIGGKSLYQRWNTPNKEANEKEEAKHHEL